MTEAEETIQRAKEMLHEREMDAMHELELQAIRMDTLRSLQKSIETLERHGDRRNALSLAQTMLEWRRSW